MKEVVWRYCCPVALRTTIFVAGARGIGMHIMVSVLLSEMVRPNAPKTSTYNIGEKPTVILYTYINQHVGTPKQKQISYYTVFFCCYCAAVLSGGCGLCLKVICFVLITLLYSSKEYCACVFLPINNLLWTSRSLDVPAGVTQEEGRAGFLIHLLSAVHALIFLARRI